MFWKIIVLFTVILQIYAQDDDRIIGGNDAKERIPYMASIRNDADVHICSGAILNPLYIVTAAQCLFIQNSTHVYVGSNFLDKGTRYIIQKRLPHKDFNWQTFQNNIGLIKTTEIIRFSASVSLIPVNPFRVGDNLEVSMFGWGVKESGGELSNVLQQLLTLTMNQKTCSEFVGEDVPDYLLCTNTGQGQGACTGDIGNPISSNNFLVAIMTSRFGCGTGPDQSTRINNFFWWIILTIISN